MHFPRRRFVCHTTVAERRSKYLNFDFPVWIKHLPFETFWHEQGLDANIRQMLAETQSLLDKAKAAELTIEGFDAAGTPSFSAKEWCQWLIQGKDEMALNTLKRNYFEAMERRGLKPDPSIKLKTQVLSRDTISHITMRLELLCT